MFSGNVTQRIARASIFQSVIGSKIAIDTAALSWVRHVRIKFKTFSMNRPQIFILVEFFAIIVAQYNGELAVQMLNEFWQFL